MSASLVSKNNQNDGYVLDDLGLPELRPSYLYRERCQLVNLRRRIQTG